MTRLRTKPAPETPDQRQENCRSAAPWRMNSPLQDGTPVLQRPFQGLGFRRVGLHNGTWLQPSGEAAAL